MKNEFIENMIFENEKDTCFGSSAYFYKHLKDKYRLNDTSPSLYGGLYRRIINYQIKTYGRSLTHYDNKISVEENILNARKDYERRKQRRGRYGRKKEN